MLNYNNVGIFSAWEVLIPSWNRPLYPPGLSMSREQLTDNLSPPKLTKKNELRQCSTFRMKALPSSKTFYLLNEGCSLFHHTLSCVLRLLLLQYSRINEFFTKAITHTSHKGTFFRIRRQDEVIPNSINTKVNCIRMKILTFTLTFSHFTFAL